MDFEREKRRSRLTQREFDRDELASKLEGLRRDLRNLLDPDEPVENLRGSQIATFAMRLAKLQIELKSVIEEIAKIKEALGI